MRDRNELVEPGLELLVPGTGEALLEQRHDLGLGAAVHEDEEPEPEPVLVDLVQGCEPAKRLGIVVRALLGGRPTGEAGGADRRVRVQRLDLGVFGEIAQDVSCAPDRIVARRERLDEARAAAEEVGKLLDAQLPR